MKKKTVAAVLAVCVMLAMTGCQNKTEAPAPATEAAAEAEAAPAAETEAALPAEDVNYESEDGWSVTYNTGEFELSEIDPHTVQFTYLGASSGSDVVSISWIEGKGPEEVLGEKTEGVEDPESIQRSEGFFPGTEDMWGYWRVIPDSGEGSGLNETLIAGEYNGGVLLFDYICHTEPDEETSMQIGDTLAALIDSITYADFEEQTMYDYYPGTYVGEEAETGSIELAGDHTGALLFQDEIPIVWSTYTLDAEDGSFSYEYTIEGDYLYLDYDGTPLTFVREGSEAAEDDGLPAYVYEGNDPYTEAVCDYLIGDVASLYSDADVFLPIPTIIAVDDSDKDDIKVWGDFWVFGYDLDEDTLLCVSGGNHPGLMHLSADGDSYTVASFDVVPDGSDFDAKAKEIFGSNYDAFVKAESDDKTREKVRSEIIKGYVNANDLAVTAYQDTGWDPVPLP